MKCAVIATPLSSLEHCIVNGAFHVFVDLCCQYVILSPLLQRVLEHTYMAENCIHLWFGLVPIYGYVPLEYCFYMY